MSGVLHPTGPEPARTYWVRRGMLLAVVLLLALGVVLAVANLTKAAVATAPPPPLPAANPASSPTPGVSGMTPTPTSTPAPSTSTSVAPSAPVSGAPTTSATPSARAASPSVSATPSPTTTVIGTPDCRPADLAVALEGDQKLSVGENTTFTVTLANAGRLTCLTSVAAANFELKIYSGKDRIWSSRDCSKALAPFDKKLPVKGAYAWKMAWNGERSVQGKNCRPGADNLRAGTYWATAQLKGADPVQVRMTIA